MDQSGGGGARARAWALCVRGGSGIGVAGMAGILLLREGKVGRAGGRKMVVSGKGRELHSK